LGNNGAFLDATISSIVNDFFTLEYTLASATYSTPDDVRRKFKRWDNPMNFTTATSNFNFIDWSTYVNEIFALTNSPPLTDNTNFTAIFMEVDVTKQLSMDIQVNFQITNKKLATSFCQWGEGSGLFLSYFIIKNFLACSKILAKPHYKLPLLPPFISLPAICASTTISYARCFYKRLYWSWNSLEKI
jgi:hypothetical protein